MIRNLMVLALFLSGGGCRKAEAPRTVSEPPPLPMPSASTGPEQKRGDVGMERALDKRYGDKPAEKDAMRAAMSRLDAQLDAEAKLAEKNRRTMVDPPEAGFKPEPVARKIKLRLVLEKSEIRINEAPRFRLEMKNVGTETIDYQETRSSLFVRGGNLLTTNTIRFFAVGDDGVKIELLPISVPRARPGKSARGGAVSAPTTMSADEREKWLLEKNAAGAANSTFKVTLNPGETLRSLGDGEAGFKAIQTDFDFDKPGVYRIHVELDDRPAPLTEQDIQDAISYSTPDQTRKFHAEQARKALGPVISNSVSLKVKR